LLNAQQAVAKKDESSETVKYKIKMKKTGTIVLLLFVFACSKAQTRSYAADVAKTVMTIWKDSLSINGKPAKWTYDQGLLLTGIENLWRSTGERKYFDYIQKSMDFFVDDNGNIRTYHYDDFTLDNITPGRELLMLYKVTNKEKYLKAVQTLRKQLKEQPRTKEGGFWHKKVYPYQMWLDGLYMAEPFYGEYANTFHDDTIFNDIARQFILMYKRSVDTKTGLLYHGYDETREEKWSDKTTGRSSNFWGRAMGWYGMGLVDAIETFPANHPKRDSLIQILNHFANAVAKAQDAKTGLWWDVLDKPNKAKNYLEASASCMFVYTLAKAVRLGYLPRSYINVAKKGYDGVIKAFIKDENGLTYLYGTVSVSGLGGNPYRDGSYDYYMSEKAVVNDPKGMGSFILAANEMEMLPTLKCGKGKTVLLDYYFNNEWKKDATGRNVRFHYTWDDRASSGFSMLGDVFHRYGAQTKFLELEPTTKNLRKADVYIIVDPDTEKETEKPNYINARDALVIAKWVRAGGVLVLMANDKGNADIEHTNILASKFGIRFNEDNFNLVQGTQFEQGAIMIPAGNSIFKTAHKVYVKELSTLQIANPKNVIVQKERKDIIAVMKYGKGTVFAIGDPWLYNEYVDGRRLSSDFDNYKAAEDLVKWLLTQAEQK